MQRILSLILVAVFSAVVNHLIMFLITASQVHSSTSPFEIVMWSRSWTSGFPLRDPVSSCTKTSTLTRTSMSKIMIRKKIDNVFCFVIVK